MTPEKIVFDFAAEKGILAGICDAEPMYYLRPLLEGRRVPFVRFTPEQRMNPRALFPAAKSIIVFAVSHNRSLDFARDSELRGHIALFAAGRDYHLEVGELFNELALRLKTIQSFIYEINVDKGPLPERELAKKCGIGRQGKNSCLITGQYGSRVSLGYMISDLCLKPAACPAPLPRSCGGCRLCADACPGRAIAGDFSPLDYMRCASYITQSKELSAWQEPIMGACLYGCDICQDVCPHNKDLPLRGSISDIDLINPKIEDVLALTDEGFKARYSLSALAWVGAERLKRNGRVAEKNLSRRC